MTFRRVALSVVALALIGGVIFALMFIVRLPLQPEYRTHVIVTSISYSSSKYSPPVAYIRFRSEGGLEGDISTPVPNLNCRVGDAVPAIQQGVTVELAPEACRKMSLP